MRAVAENIYKQQDIFACLDSGADLFADDLFASLQAKARDKGVSGLTPKEKAAYVDFLRLKTAQEKPLPSSTEPKPLPASSNLPEYRIGQNTRTYAGIGSRETPEDVCEIMRKLAGYLEAKGYTLLTGDAAGADSAFSSGCRRKRIFTAAHATELTLEIAQEIHPAPWLLPTYAKRLMARNTFQVFGAKLDIPVDFLLCWTEDACTSHATRTRETGGTGQAIALASLKGIPVINIKNASWREQLKEALANAGAR